MSKTVLDCIRTAAAGFAVIPTDSSGLRIKDNIPDQQDWREFNKKLCVCIRLKGCPVLEGELDSFWEENRTFGELVEYIDDHCGFRD
jgi:hypothetical protein